MKKLLFSMIAMATMLFATSCQNDETLATNENTASVSFTVSLPEVATRAGEGTTATKLHYAVYETDAEGNWGKMLIKREATISNRAANVSIELATSKKYGFIFWAEAEGAPYSIDWENKAMALNTTQVANNEAMDAFYSAFQYDVEKAFTQEVKLTRPFAQLNIGQTTTQMLQLPALCPPRLRLL